MNPMFSNNEGHRCRPSSEKDLILQTQAAFPVSGINSLSTEKSPDNYPDCIESDDIFIIGYPDSIIIMNTRWILCTACLILAVISPMCANPYYLYGYQGHIYASYVTFSDNDVITYYLDSPSSADFDLIVYDTYDGKAYLSQNDGNAQESARVPASKGYDHVVFIDGVSGQGAFSLFTGNDSVTWNNDAFTDLGEYHTDAEVKELSDAYYQKVLNLSSVNQT